MTEDDDLLDALVQGDGEGGVYLTLLHPEKGGRGRRVRIDKDEMAVFARHLDPYLKENV